MPMRWRIGNSALLLLDELQRGEVKPCFASKRGEFAYQLHVPQLADAKIVRHRFPVGISREPVWPPRSRDAQSRPLPSTALVTAHAYRFDPALKAIHAWIKQHPCSPR